MHRYVLRRLLLLIPVLAGVLLIVFTMNYITPGDPARLLAGETSTAEVVEGIREELGLNDPFLVQFSRYVWNLVSKGDLGTSYQSKQPVAKELMERFPTTLLLAVLSTLLSVSIGIPIGVLAAVKQYSIWDRASMSISLIGVAMPTFWQGLLNILIFSIFLGWLPSSGFDSWRHWILPVITVGTGSAGSLARFTRSSMLEVIRQDYIRTARAKGQTEGRIIVLHALKNAMIPILTVVGMQFGGLLGGAVLTETVFAIPGLGKFMTDAIKARNYPVTQGGVLVLAFMYSGMNLLVDILYAFLDPRIRSAYAGHKRGAGRVKG